MTLPDRWRTLRDGVAGEATGWLAAADVLVQVDQALTGWDMGDYTAGETLRRIAAAGAAAERVLVAGGRHPDERVRLLDPAEARRIVADAFARGYRHRTAA